MSFLFRGPTVQALTNVYWAKVIAPPPAGSSWARDEESPISLYSMQSIVAKEFKQGPRIVRRAFRLTVTGSVIIEVSNDPAEPVTEATGGGGSYGGSTYDYSAANVVNARAAVTGGGTVDYFLAGPSPNRKSLTIQNIGIIAVWVARGPNVIPGSPQIDGIGNGADALLAGGAAANDGTGGVVTWDGYIGSIYVRPVGDVAGGVLLLSVTLF